MRIVFLLLGWALVAALLGESATVFRSNLAGAVFLLEVGVIVATVLIRLHLRGWARSARRTDAKRATQMIWPPVLAFEPDQGTLTSAVSQTIHFGDLARIFPGRHASRGEAEAKPTTVDLIPEPAASGDGRAVAVACGGLVVGHLDWDTAGRYAPVLDVLAKRGTTMQVAGRVCRRTHDDQVGYVVQVWLPAGDAIKRAVDSHQVTASETRRSARAAAHSRNELELSKESPSPRPKVHRGVRQHSADLTHRVGSRRMASVNAS